MTEVSEEPGAAAGSVGAAGALLALRAPGRGACEEPAKEEPMRLPHAERGAQGTVWGSIARSPQGWCCRCAPELCLQCGEAAAPGLCSSL